MKILVKKDTKTAIRELRDRAMNCAPHTMCPRCLRGRG